jgi:hypothetical protein
VRKLLIGRIWEDAHAFLAIAMPAVVVRQRKSWRRKDGITLYFEVCNISGLSIMAETYSRLG